MVILNKMLSEINNRKSDFPLAEYRKQKFEYVPVEVVNLERDGDYKYLPATIIQYDCMFLNSDFSEHGHFKFDENGIEYKVFDKEKNCIFCVSMHTGYEEVIKSCTKMRSNRKYNNSIFYRNSFVTDDYDHSYNFEKDRLSECIDYSINMLNDNADEMLTLGRNQIKENYKRKLSDLIDYEVKQFIKQVVDELLSKKYEIAPSLLLMIYQATKGNDYKYSDLQKQYSEIFDKLQIGGYIKFDEDCERKEEQEKKFKASELMGKQLYFIHEYSGVGQGKMQCGNFDKNIYEKMCDGKFAALLEKEENEEFFHMEAEGSLHHPINHRLKKRFIYFRNEKLYEVRIAEPFLTQNDEVYEMDDFFKIQNLLEIIFVNRRCITTWAEFSNLQTFINWGLSRYGGIPERQIEVEMNEKIKEQIATELLSEGYVKECEKRFLYDVYSSKEFRDNLQYIINEHEGCDVRQLEEEYKCLWQNLLKLLEEERFSEYNKMQSAYLKEQSAKRYFGRSDEVFGHYFTR